MMKFGPQNKAEAEIFALEKLRADVQYQIMRRMKEAGLSQAALAKRMGTSPAWISQMLSDDANLTLESISKVFLALESKCEVVSSPLDLHYVGALWEEGFQAVTQWQPDTLVAVQHWEALDFSKVYVESMRNRGERFASPSKLNDNHPRNARCLEAA